MMMSENNNFSDPLELPRSSTSEEEKVERKERRELGDHPPNENSLVINQ